MALLKFRSLEEMNNAPQPPSASDFDRFLRHCARYWTIAPRDYPRGVFKFRSVDQMERPVRASVKQ